ncbi:hypothetical protein [Pseudomonas sp. CC120222-01a]|uniref:hypothetical protein n=1 Tax=Pseudomonas sp. CC120222-01a TaxID=1378075 RepID=UPI000D8BDD97|nr:hypothetical protein [Pseudomonas sp. CC120222-01a]PVZ39084.1 hypothetical protein N430_03958 [Pseudomonas sp. CC120222-01a]
MLNKQGQVAMAITFMLGLGATETAWPDPTGTGNTMTAPTSQQPSSTSLSNQQQAVVILAALAAAGDMPRLNTALDQA